MNDDDAPAAAAHAVAAPRKRGLARVLWQGLRAFGAALTFRRLCLAMLPAYAPTDLTSAKLSGAMLRGACLARASLSGITANGSDLTGADTTGATFDPTAPASAVGWPSPSERSRACPRPRSRCRGPAAARRQDEPDNAKTARRKQQQPL